MGDTLPFITLAGFHSLNDGMFDRPRLRPPPTSTR